MYYDGCKLLSLLDLKGKDPDIYISTSNRSAGKTTFFLRMVINRFLTKQKKFCLLYRYSYEMESSNNYYKDVKQLFFQDCDFDSNLDRDLKINFLMINNQNCGYGISLNNVDAIKKNSHLLNDVDTIIFDEFQPETNKYLKDEVNKLISVHRSIARGGGAQVRRVRLIMISNHVCIYNPYYVSLGIHKKLYKNTKYLRGNGFVLENNYNEHAAKANLESGFMRAFSDRKYSDYIIGSGYLYSNENFVEKINGKKEYLLNIVQNKEYIGIYSVNNFLYASDEANKCFNVNITTNIEDHCENTTLISRYSPYFLLIKSNFDKGYFRFKNEKIKNDIIDFLC